MSWEGKVYVTGANPAPGQSRPIEGALPDKSGNIPTLPDGGVGINVYVAGGAGPEGAVPVYLANAGSGSTGNFVDITSPLQSGSLLITGSVRVVNTGVFVTNTASVMLRDSVGNDLEFQSENDNWNAADHGLLVFGRDVESVPNKYRSIRLDGDGRVIVHIANSGHDQLEFLVKDFNTGGPVENVAIMGLALPSSGGAVIGGTPQNPVSITGSVYVLNPSTGGGASGSVSQGASGSQPWKVEVTNGLSGSTAAPVKPTGSLATRVGQSTSAVLLATSDLTRVAFSIFNDSDANLMVYYGASSTGSDSWTFRMLPGALYETGQVAFAGAVYGKWDASGSGYARFTSLA